MLSITWTGFSTHIFPLGHKICTGVIYLWEGPCGFGSGKICGRTNEYVWMWVGKNMHAYKYIIYVHGTCTANLTPGILFM